jgi:predicted PurR-regulated permease PerM
MLITILVIATIIACVCKYIYEKSNKQEVYRLAENCMWAGVVVVIFSIALVLVISIMVSHSFVIDEKLAMYEEENTKIEERIATVVEQYQQYETDIFESVAPKDAVTYVSLYPELKSDTLVQTQIEVYMANNEKIKALREEKIDAKILKWWLYFGG